MRRRTVIGVVGGVMAAGALAALDPVREELDLALGLPVTPDDLDEWERAATEHARLSGLLPASELLPALTRDLSDIRRQLTTAPEDLRPRLAQVSASLGAVAAIVLTNGGYWGEANRYWRLADRAARYSGDRTLTSQIAGRRSVFAIYSPLCGPPGVLALADNAMSWAGDRACAGAASALAARAQVLAVEGDRPGAHDALAQLESVFDRLPDAVRAAPPGAWSWGEPRVHHVRSYVHSHLGDTSAAATAQDAALRLYTHPKSLGAAQVRLHQALTLIKSGDPTGGLHHMMTVLESVEPSFRRGPLRINALQALAVVPASMRGRPQVHQLRDLLSADVSA